MRAWGLARSQLVPGHTMDVSGTCIYTFDTKDCSFSHHYPFPFTRWLYTLSVIDLAPSLRGRIQTGPLHPGMLRHGNRRHPASAALLSHAHRAHWRGRTVPVPQMFPRCVAVRCIFKAEEICQGCCLVGTSGRLDALPGAHPVALRLGICHLSCCPSSKVGFSGATEAQTQAQLRAQN